MLGTSLECRQCWQYVSSACHPAHTVQVGNKSESLFTEDRHFHLRTPKVTSWEAAKQAITGVVLRMSASAAVSPKSGWQQLLEQRTHWASQLQEPPAQRPGGHRPKSGTLTKLNSATQTQSWELAPFSTG